MSAAGSSFNRSQLSDLSIIVENTNNKRPSRPQSASSTTKPRKTSLTKQALLDEDDMDIQSLRSFQKVPTRPSSANPYKQQQQQQQHQHIQLQKEVEKENQTVNHQNANYSVYRLDEEMSEPISFSDNVSIRSYNASPTNAKYQE